MDPNRLKKEITDEIFGKLRAAGIDVEVALGASHGKSSCATKEVEQQLAAPAGELSPPSPGRRSMPDPSPPPSVDVACRTPTNALGSSHDEPDTFDMLNGPTSCSLKAGGFSTLMMELATGVVLPEDKVCHTVPV